MLDVHHKGKAIVSSGARERMEYDASRLQAYGLWATVDQRRERCSSATGRSCVARVRAPRRGRRCCRRGHARGHHAAVGGLRPRRPGGRAALPGRVPATTRPRRPSCAGTWRTTCARRSSSRPRCCWTTCRSEGGEVALDEEQAEAWLRALTDVRLALGLRLASTTTTDIEEELDEAVLQDPTSARVGQLSVYAYLTYLQESPGRRARWDERPGEGGHEASCARVSVGCRRADHRRRDPRRDRRACPPGPPRRGVRDRGGSGRFGPARPGTSRWTTRPAR